MWYNQSFEMFFYKTLCENNPLSCKFFKYLDYAFYLHGLHCKLVQFNNKVIHMYAP